MPGFTKGNIAEERQRRPDPACEIAHEGGASIGCRAIDANKRQPPGLHRQRSPSAGPRPRVVKGADPEHEGKREHLGGKVGDAQPRFAGRSRGHQRNRQKSSDQNERRIEDCLVSECGEAAGERGGRWRRARGQVRFCHFNSEIARALPGKSSLAPFQHDDAVHRGAVAAPGASCGGGASVGAGRMLRLGAAVAGAPGGGGALVARS